MLHGYQLLYQLVRQRRNTPLFTGKCLSIGAEALGDALPAPNHTSSLTVLINEECWLVYYQERKAFGTEQTCLHLNPGSTTYLHQLFPVCKMEMIRPAAQMEVRINLDGQTV